MLRRRQWWVAIVLFGFIFLSSCNFPFHPKVNKTTVSSISVSPAVGLGEFTLELGYSYYFVAGEVNDLIRCSYTTPGGSSILIGMVKPNPPEEVLGDLITVDGYDKKTFTVKPINGEVETGLYTLVCYTEVGDSEKSTSFAVIASGETVATPTNTPENQAAATPTNTPTPEPQPITGKILFDYNGYQSERAGGGGEIDLVISKCVPKVRFMPNGTVIGECVYNGQTNHLGQSEITIRIDGTFVPGGTITFTYYAYETGPVFVPDGVNDESDPYAEWSINFSGSGMFNTATQASGTANFTYNCNSHYEYDFWCGNKVEESFSGSIPWTFIADP